jgi:hypothetical protein
MRPTRIICSAVILSCAAIASPQDSRKKPPAPAVIWAESWDKALEEARERNAPIHVVCHADLYPCEACAAEFQRADYVKSSRNWVNLVICKDTSHGEEETKSGDEDVKRCKRYPGIACSVHVANQSAIPKLTKETELRVPISWFLDSSGKTVGKQADGKLITAGDIVKGMDAAAKACGPDRLSAEEYQACLKARRDLAEGIENGDYKRVNAAGQLLQKAKTKTFQSEGKEAFNKLSDIGDALLKEAQDLVATDKTKARKLLETLASDFKPLACSHRATEFLKSLAKQPR